MRREARVFVDTDGQQLPGQPLTFLLTSVDCSPCLKEPLLVEVPAVSGGVGRGWGACGGRVGRPPCRHPHSEGPRTQKLKVRVLGIQPSNVILSLSPCLCLRVCVSVCLSVCLSVLLS